MKTYVFGVDEQGVQLPFTTEGKLITHDDWLDLVDKMAEFHGEFGEGYADFYNGDKPKKTSSKRSKKPKRGHVYFIGCGDTGIKIGVTKSLNARLRALQTSSPFKLELLYDIVVEDMHAVEQAAHNSFSKKRLRGEWFDVTYEEVIQWVADQFRLGMLK